MRSQNRGQKHSSFDQRRFPDHSSFSIDSGETVSFLLPHILQNGWGGGLMVLSILNLV